MKSSKPKARVKILRYDPNIDSEPRYKIYTVPFEPKVTKVLDALCYIRNNYDKTLAFEYGCRRRRCGICTIWVNDGPQLLCNAILDKDITLEPLHNFPVVKDLVIDRTSVYKKMTAIQPYLRRIKRPKKGPESIETTSPFYEKYTSLATCIECLCCQSVCPAFEIAPTEFAGPLPLLAVTKRFYDPRDDADRVKQSVYEGLFNCTFCGKCEEVCPKEIEITKIVTRALYQAASNEKIGPPDPFKKMAARAGETGRTIARTTAPLLQELPYVIRPTGSNRRVGLFTGCVIDHELQDVGRATVEVLRKNGIEVVVPKDQSCCGMPLMWTGQADTVRRDLIPKNIEAFEKTGVETVITVCPSCGMFWREDIIPIAEKLIGRKPKFRVVDINVFLAKEIELNTRDMNSVNARVTYHDPCHLRRGIGVYKEPRELIQMIPGVEFVDMSYPDRCCGGFLRYNRPDLANKLSSQKVKLAAETEAAVLATSCPLCLTNLTIGLVHARHKQKQLKEMSVVYLVNLLADSYRNSKQSTRHNEYIW